MGSPKGDSQGRARFQTSRPRWFALGRQTCAQARKRTRLGDLGSGHANRSPIKSRPVPSRGLPLALFEKVYLRPFLESLTLCVGPSRRTLFHHLLSVGKGLGFGLTRGQTPTRSPRIRGNSSDSAFNPSE